MIGAEMFSGTYEWDERAFAESHAFAFVDPSRFGDPMERLNQSEQIRVSASMGREGSDYQNPQLFLGNGIYAGVPDLQPNYGSDGDTAANVALNVRATAGFIQR